MGKEITWREIYREFQQKLPTLSKQALDYRPADFMTIAVYLKDGSRVLYDGMKKCARFERTT